MYNKARIFTFSHTTVGRTYSGLSRRAIDIVFVIYQIIQNNKYPLQAINIPTYSLSAENNLMDTELHVACMNKKSKP
jgi:hypothetical protein